jgi:hypothetical protein
MDSYTYYVLGYSHTTDHPRTPPPTHLQPIQISKFQAQALNYFTICNSTTHVHSVKAQPINAAEYSVYKEDGYLALEAGAGNNCVQGFCSKWTTFVSITIFICCLPSDNSHMRHSYFSNSCTMQQTFTGSLNYYSVDHDFPTMSPTAIPTTSVPTSRPTSMPTKVNIQLQTPTVNSAYTAGAFYFEVYGGSKISAITDLLITTSNTKVMEVYTKEGSAAPFESTPCAWKKVAETPASWTGSGTHWQRLYPKWKNGFDPVLLPPNAKVAFYVVAKDDGNFLVTQHSNANKYMNISSANATSPFGNVVMTSGRSGYNNNQLFRPFLETWRQAVSNLGGVKIEEVPEESTRLPTPAPTTPFMPASSLTSPFGAGSTKNVHGLQFEVVNRGSKDIVINKLQVPFSTGSHPVEVWFRNGSYKGFVSNCAQWMNEGTACVSWTKLAEGSITSSVSLFIQNDFFPVLNVNSLNPNALHCRQTFHYRARVASPAPQHSWPL